MEKELSLGDIIKEIILFFIKFRNIIILTTALGTLGVVIFQRLQPAFYNTKAIAISGISSFERIDSKTDLNQRLAVTLINLLQLDVNKEDYISLSKKMNISFEDASTIRSIKAEELTFKDRDQKTRNTSKFSISLSVYNNKSISLIQDGLDYYFQNNLYIKKYYDQFISTTSNEISAIDQEVNSLNAIRALDKSAIDVSSINVNSKSYGYDANNQILDLISLKSKNVTDLALLRPLSFVSPFTESETAERGIFFSALLSAAISFLLGIIIAVFKNVYVNSNK